MPGNSDRVIRLFDELISEGEGIRAASRRLYFSGQKKGIAPDEYESWKTNCLSLLKSTFGISSPYYESFNGLKFFDYYNSTQIYLGILKGARGDLQKGYFFHKDLMLSVRIYNSLIGRALQHAGRGGTRQAAVILDATLLEILSRICESRKVQWGPQDCSEDLAQRLAGDGLLDGDALRAVARTRQLLAEAGEGCEDEAAEAVTAAAQWLQEFLSAYLAARIVILN